MQEQWFSNFLHSVTNKGVYFFYILLTVNLVMILGK